MIENRFPKLFWWVNDHPKLVRFILVLIAWAIFSVLVLSFPVIIDILGIATMSAITFLTSFKLMER